MVVDAEDTVSVKISLVRKMIQVSRFRIDGTAFAFGLLRALFRMFYNNVCRSSGSTGLAKIRL